ncbi:hypothetical protein GALMADRAFT_246694 [Galerina marginata CBS 339.88]|uniref:Uncharacterized protein n=1 Tax=Galerina marginata (strain CBS 339.88) TaxID=685588 RepID=A0A067TEB6_GALM3|nr:hypothetical protein GALMADRAFT_246694 [Galerina marginata CBS 339.88]
MKIPLQGSSFSLDVSGIAGFFGGEESFAAMSSVHLVRGRRWLGWYNSPGSYFVAKKYGVLAKSRVWDGLFPGVNVDPTTMLELDGKVGPRYVAALSGTRLAATGHLAYLFANHCKNVSNKQITGPPQSLVTIVELGNFEEFKGYPTLPDAYISNFDPFAIIPIAFSIAASVMSAIFGDWYCFAMIFLGIFCNGISCFVIGSGVLKLSHPDSSPHSPAGDGLFLQQGHTILVKGSEKLVSSITRGSYYLEYKSESKYHDIGYSSVALTTQFLLQLFLVPQGQLFGQIMFLSSLGVSWIFNGYLASIDKEVLQTKTLSGVLKLKEHTIKTRQFQKWTAVVVFATCLLNPGDPRAFLDELVPNNTQAWKVIKQTIVEGIQQNEDPKEILEEKSEKKNGLNDSEQGLLKDMINQASIGYLAAREFK